MKSGKDQFKEAKKAFRDAMKDPKASQDELTAKFEAFQKLRGDHQRKKFGQMLEMRSILKPDQVEKFMAMKERSKQMRRGKKTF